ncbi:D-2-hydroxyacid dehydrogenase [Motiliproteus sediminis]|uniref:D-2-hydroxyacid dehydrogenase n=1 Tax=Motiliproteus sediminis TaxID=1468178 RepID=UPI001AEF8D51|nr:D-2-hydroxyacid dehydrogenase [Motiliproteus sediminis]
MSEPSVAIVSKQANAYADALATSLTTAPLTFTETPAASALAEVPVVLADPDLIAPLVPRLPDLRWLQSTWAGVTPLIRQPARHYQLTNIRGVFGPLMVEYVFGHLLAIERQHRDHYHATRQQRWHPVEPGVLRGKTLGLMGMGSIGTALAEAGRFFGLTVLGYSRSGGAHPTLERAYCQGQLAEMLPHCDYLVASLPSTLATRNQLDGEAFSVLKPGAVLINVGRGNLIDEEALIQALGSGRLRAAVVDVFRQEPLPSSHPLWQTPNLLVTSHTAAPSRVADIAPIFIDNYHRFSAGMPLLHRVDFERGY